MNALDVTGLLILSYATVVSSIELGRYFAQEAAEANREREALRERPSSLPRVRW